MTTKRTMKIGDKFRAMIPAHITSTVDQIDRTNVFHVRIWNRGKLISEAKVAGFLNADGWRTMELAKFAVEVAA